MGEVGIDGAGGEAGDPVFAAMERTAVLAVGATDSRTVVVAFRALVRLRPGVTADRQSGGRLRLLLLYRSDGCC